MARRTKAQIERDERIEAEKEEKIAQLGDYGLEPRQDVRFRRKKGGNWIEGHALYVNSDGSICIGASAKKMAGMYSIMPDMVERSGVGPRGGRIWEPLEGMDA